MIIALTIWCILGFAGFVVLMTQMILDQGWERAIANLFDDWWFGPAFLVACIAGGGLSLAGAIFIAYYLPRS